MNLKLRYPTANIEPENEIWVGSISYALKQMFWDSHIAVLLDDYFFWKKNIHLFALAHIYPKKKETGDCYFWQFVLIHGKEFLKMDLVAFKIDWNTRFEYFKSKVKVQKNSWSFYGHYSLYFRVFKLRTLEVL